MNLFSFSRSFINLAFSFILKAIICTSSESVLEKTPEEIKSALIKHEIIPDLLDEAPLKAVQVEWGEGPYVNFGNVINDFGAIKESPFWIEWEGNNMEDHYCLFMLGLDEPSRGNHSLREWKYWIMVNIEGHNTTVVGGESLADYLPPYPIIGTGMHRYVFLVYKQKQRRFKMFRERRLYPKRIDKERGKFSVKKFAKKYNIDGPIAVNFFLCEGQFPPITEPPTTTEVPRIFDPNRPRWSDERPKADKGGYIW